MDFTGPDRLAASSVELFGSFAASQLRSRRSIDAGVFGPQSHSLPPVRNGMETACAAACAASLALGWTVSRFPSRVHSPSCILPADLLRIHRSSDHGMLGRTGYSAW